MEPMVFCERLVDDAVRTSLNRVQNERKEVYLEGTGVFRTFAG
jgi:hypothetical protein